MSVGRSQFKPRARGVPLRLQERDIEILQAVYEHRFLDSQQIKAVFSCRVADPVVGGEKTNEAIGRRLYKLFHHGYLDRPRGQLELRIRYGNRPLIYALGDEGATVLAQERGEEITTSGGWKRKNDKVQGPHILHKLMIAKFHVAVVLALKEHPGTRLLMWRGEEGLRGAWMSVSTKKGSRKLHILPDGLLSIQRTDRSENNRGYFFLEADRGTNSAVRFFETKVRGYLAYYRHGGHTRDLKIQEFRVLTVTTSARRRDHLRETIAKRLTSHGKNRRRFLFAADEDYSVQAPHRLLENFWYGVDGDTAVDLLGSG